MPFNELIVRVSAKFGTNTYAIPMRLVEINVHTSQLTEGKMRQISFFQRHISFDPRFVLSNDKLYSKPNKTQIFCEKCVSKTPIHM